MIISSSNRHVYGQTARYTSIFFVFVLLSVLAGNVCSAIEYYVSPGGYNGNSGTSIAGPWRTLQYAADHASPGDIINIMSGTFTATGWDPIIKLDPNHSGTADAWITYRPAPGHHPVIKAAGYFWQLFQISANYIKIEDLELVGNNDAITLEEAEAAYEQSLLPEPPWGMLGWYNTSGISITNAHHVTVSGCVIHDFQGAGVWTGAADYITIEDNVIYNNAWYSVWAESGISLWTSQSIDSFTGRKNFIRRNICFNNKSLIKWVSCQCYSDGNGIIIDGTKYYSYIGQTLVAYNLVFNNGGSGIHSVNSTNVDILNNTAFENSQVLDYGEIFTNATNDANVFNNIMWARTGRQINSNYNNVNVTHRNNIFYNGTPVVWGPNDLLNTDPKFFNPTTDPSTYDFRLRPDSPAVNSAVYTAEAVALNHIAIPQGLAPDRGAYERPCGSNFAGDLDNDCIVSFEDVRLFVSQWLGAEPQTDFDGSGYTDISDFALMADNWGF